MKAGVKRFWKTIIPQSWWKKIFSAAAQLVPNQFLAVKGVTSMWWSLENLKRLGFSPATVIDVGAYKGNWTLEVKKIFSDAQFLMVEAQPDKESRLEQIAQGNQNIFFELGLVGSADGEEKVFTVMKTGSSVYEQTYEGKSDRKKITLKSNTIDSIIDKYQLPGPYFLKMDVQGYEIEVLKGATHLLLETPVILLEASLLNYNAGAPLVDEIIAFLKQKDYLLFDICEFHRKSDDGVLNQVDLIFCKKDWDIRNKVNF